MTRMRLSVLLRWPPLALLLATLVGLGTAGPLTDPTRPPATVALQPPAPPAAPGTRPAPPASAPAPVRVLQLQAVQMTSQGQATAMIDGQLLRLGDAIGDRLVVGIDREGVVLRGKAGSERLLLLAADSHKRPPGSVVTTRSASFTPAAAPLAATARSGQRLPTDDAHDTADERPDHADAPSGGKPLSVAERTKP